MRRRPSQTSLVWALWSLWPSHFGGSFFDNLNSSPKQPGSEHDCGFGTPNFNTLHGGRLVIVGTICVVNGSFPRNNKDEWQQIARPRASACDADPSIRFSPPRVSSPPRQTSQRVYEGKANTTWKTHRFLNWLHVSTESHLVFVLSWIHQPRGATRLRPQHSLTQPVSAMHTNMADGQSEMTAVDQDDGQQPQLHRSSSSEESVTGRESRVGQLARTFSRNSTAFTSAASNPFLNSKDPSLDPSSPEFDAKKWVIHLLGAFSQDPDRYARHTLGVSYRNLGIHGFGRPTDYQKDVLNMLWRAPLLLRDVVSKQQTKIQILKDFDGLIKRGEMLLVLGRPGRRVRARSSHLPKCSQLATDQTMQRCINTPQDDFGANTRAALGPVFPVQLPRHPMGHDAQAFSWRSHLPSRD